MGVYILGFPRYETPSVLCYEHYRTPPMKLFSVSVLGAGD